MKAGFGCVQIGAMKEAPSNFGFDLGSKPQ